MTCVYSTHTVITYIIPIVILRRRPLGRRKGLTTTAAAVNYYQITTTNDDDDDNNNNYTVKYAEEEQCRWLIDFLDNCVRRRRGRWPRTLIYSHNRTPQVSGEVLHVCVQTCTRVP